jgi:hypothetical protein
MRRTRRRQGDFRLSPAQSHPVCKRERASSFRFSLPTWPPSTLRRHPHEHPLHTQPHHDRRALLAVQARPGHDRRRARSGHPRARRLPLVAARRGAMQRRHRCRGASARTASAPPRSSSCGPCASAYCRARRMPTSPWRCEERGDDASIHSRPRCRRVREHPRWCGPAGAEGLRVPQHPAPGGADDVARRPILLNAARRAGHDRFFRNSPEHDRLPCMRRSARRRTIEAWPLTAAANRSSPCNTTAPTAGP